MSGVNSVVLTSIVDQVVACIERMQLDWSFNMIVFALYVPLVCIFM